MPAAPANSNPPPARPARQTAAYREAVASLRARGFKV